MLNILSHLGNANQIQNEILFIPTNTAVIVIVVGDLVTKSSLTLCDPTTVNRQAPLSTGFSRQEYWSRLLFPSPGDLPHPGIKPGSSALKVDSLLTEPYWDISSSRKIVSIDGDVKKQTLGHCWWECKWCSCYGKQYGNYSKKLQNYHTTQQSHS